MYYGTVVQKIIDTADHFTPYVWIRSERSKERVELSWDLDRAFNVIAVGDTLFKDMNSDTLQVYNGKKRLRIRMYRCSNRD